MIKGLVSVITPTYNCAKFIAETIESVQAQTYENWEMVIVDDCSKDDTKAIVDGYIAKDIATNSSATGNFGFYNGTNFGLDENFYKKAAPGENTIICITNPDHKIRTSYEIGDIATYTSIPVTAVNPVRSIKFMDLIRSEEGAAIANLICYGIEGKHYEKTGENTIRAFEYETQGSYNVSYGIPQWKVGNNFNMYLVAPLDMDWYNYGKNYYENVLPAQKKHPLYGYGFSTNNVTLYFSNVAAVNLEYEPQLAYGIMKDYNEGLKTMNDRIKAAGIDNMISDFQKQADDYIASNK